MRSDALARRARTLLPLGVVGALTACALEFVTLPVRPSVIVVHAVLSPSRPYQDVLVERTLTGEAPVSRYYTGDGLFPSNTVSSEEPIISDGGNPERGATVELTLPGGATIVTLELAIVDTINFHGAGVYRFPLAGAALVPGGRYDLKITTAAGEVVTASTTVPLATAFVAAGTQGFDRDDDTLSLFWGSAPGARAYEVRVESPFTPWVALTDSDHVALTGALRNLRTDDYAHVMVPGFRQGVTVSAIDENLYEYYRTSSDAATGTGIVNRVTGGLGVFGSYVTLIRRTLDVTASTSEPIEGTFDLVAYDAGIPYGGASDAQTITLYVETPATADKPARVTGSFMRSFGTTPGAAVGRLTGDSLRLSYLRGQTIADTAEVLRARLVGDTIFGRFSRGAEAKYARRTP